ncbi:hypothetical protein [Actinoplanes sp. ATCC 53533]|nr:hypothetical protein [Actinoplanes sp. ATCC 53533]
MTVVGVVPGGVAGPGAAIAAEQARYWTALLDQTRAAELEMTDPPR